MIFKIVDGRSCFYQWDIDRQISVSDPTITEVHFCNRTEACSLVVEVKDGIANVPNKVLQNGYPVRVFGYDGKATLHEATFEVKARTKPIDYIYTETEIKHYEDLEKRLDEIEKNGISEEVITNAVNSYLEENPIDVDLTGYATEEYVNEAVKNVEVDLTGYATKEEVDTAIYDSKDAYYLDFVDAPEGSANAVEATDDMAEFAERFKASKNVCVHIKETNPEGFNKWSPALISGVANNIRLQVATTVAKGGHDTDFIYFEYHIKWSSSAGQWLMYKERLGETEFATKEYVDEQLANIDIPEVPEVDLSGCIKFYNFSSLASPSEADYAKLKEIVETDDINAYLFTVDGTHKVLRTSNMGGGVTLIVYGVWNGPTNNTIYGYQVDYNNNTSTLLVSYKMVSSDEVQSMINEAFNNIGVAEGGAY